jgi:hypothetical protein
MVSVIDIWRELASLHDIYICIIARSRVAKVYGPPKCSKIHWVHPYGKAPGCNPGVSWIIADYA